MEALLKKPQKLIIAVRGDDAYAVATSYEIPTVPRRPFETHILSPGSPAPKGAVVMFTADEGMCFRGTHLHSPLYSCDRVPAWAKGCVGFIALRPVHAEAWTTPESSTIQSALASAIRVGWARRERRSAY